MSAPQSANGSKRSKREIEKASLIFFNLSSRRLVTSLLLFGLIIEWLLPLAQLEAYTELYRIGPLIAAVGLSLAVGLLVPPAWLSLLLNGAICLGTVLVMFKVQYSSPYESWVGLIHGLRADVQHLMDGEMQLSGETRTLLLVAGLGMMAAAVQSLVWLRQWGLGLAALTAVYLLILYGFLGLNVFPGLLRTCVEGLLLSALLTIPRLERLSGAKIVQVSMNGAYDRQYDDKHNQVHNSTPEQKQNQSHTYMQNPTSNPDHSITNTRNPKRPLSLFGWPVRWWSGATWLAVIIAAAGIGAAWGRNASSEPAPWAAEAVNWGKTHLREEQLTTAVQGQTMQPIEITGGLGSAGITGYGFDDRSLGAPLSLSAAVLFTVQSPAATYLRGESKSVYNGHGWEQPEQLLEERIIGSDRTQQTIAGGDLISAEGSGVKLDLAHTGTKEDIFAGITGSLTTAGSYDSLKDKSAAGQTDGSGTNAITQTVTVAYPTEGWPLLAAGPDAQVIAMQTADGTKREFYRFNKLTDAMYPASSKDRLTAYTVSTRLPDPASLRSNRTEQGAGVPSDPADLLQTYTQLPEGLPARIGQLAGQISGQLGAGASRYEKSKAIEDYLRSHYVYTLTDTAVPAAGADFVDNFLFEQKQGYCVHFASAMVVMLRTQGIPARYVKGFAPGEAAGSENSERIGAGISSAGSGDGISEGGAGSAKTQAFTVRASDAHAWVEVYFEGVGWVAFEPTPGFAAVPSLAGAGSSAASAGQPADAAEQGAAAAGDFAAAAGARGLAGRAAAQLQAAAEQAADAAQRGAHALAQAARSAAAARPWAMAALAAGATGAAGLAAAAWRRRERDAFARALHKYGSALAAGRRTAARGQFLELADICWRELYARRGAKPPHSTAREYAAALNLPPHMTPLIAQFVRWDEQARYGSEWSEPPTHTELADLRAAIQSLNSAKQSKQQGTVQSV
ncbi:transglutaminase domain-containing protein [Paenibacillus solisilvae]|uniref:Transglutaminase domain-containing protein n=1 Tax=Paenibacillus solisilvae TaxID=2486751 RepID=A0ABW0W174_9BACL